MCNLSQGIKEEGIRLGEKRGEKRGERRGAAAMAQLFGKLMDAGRKEEWQRVINDEEYRNRLIRKMNL